VVGLQKLLLAMATEMAAVDGGNAQVLGLGVPRIAVNKIRRIKPEMFYGSLNI
jgi:hypothetical protein